MAAGAQRFKWSPVNPNDSIGGAGCACSEARNEDRGGPYKVFYATEMANDTSPHVVVCAPCAGGPPADVELTTAGNIDSVAVEIVEPYTPEREANPVTEGDWSEDLPSI